MDSLRLRRFINIVLVGLCYLHYLGFLDHLWVFFCSVISLKIIVKRPTEAKPRGLIYIMLLSSYLVGNLKTRGDFSLLQQIQSYFGVAGTITPKGKICL